MDISGKAHAATNISVGIAGILSPWWMNALNITEYVLHFVTVLGGAILVLYQLKSMYSKRNEKE